MHSLAWTVAILGGQLFAAAALTLPAGARAPGPGRRAVARARLARTTLRPGLAALGVAAAVLASRSPDAVPDGTLTLAVVCGAASAAGSFGLLAAGRLERAGRVRPARGLAREAGRYAAAGAVATLALPPLAGAGGAIALGVGAAALLQGSAALLGALSGKPRPAGAVAAAAWLGCGLLLGRLVAG